MLLNLIIFTIISIIVPCIIGVYLWKLYFRLKTSKYSFRLIEDGIGEYAVQEYDHFDNSWRTIAMSCDLKEMEKCYLNKITEFNKRRMEELKDKELRKLRKKVKIIKQNK